jgi:hypothetical protein
LACVPRLPCGAGDPPRGVTAGEPASDDPGDDEKPPLSRASPCWYSAVAVPGPGPSRAEVGLEVGLELGRDVPFVFHEPFPETTRPKANAACARPLRRGFFPADGKPPS